MLCQSPIIIAGAMLVSISAAHAGSPGAVSIVPPLPAGYNPTTASAGLNARYAVPPEPDAAAAPRAHAAWTRAMHSVGRRASATITPTKRRHTPIANKHAVAEANGVIAVQSANWSGTSIVGYPAAGLRAVTGMFVVPEAHQANGECGAPKWASIWPGIDGNGNGNSDVLQAGVNAVALCVIDVNTGQGSVVGEYFPWIEWYPNYETELSSPVLNPGNLVFVEVWNTSPTQGYAYFYNYTTDESAEYSITAPSGTALQDASVEWIVERPEGGGVLTPLTNYVDVPWADGVAWNYAAISPATYLLGQSPSNATLENFTMLDDDGNPISAATIENDTFLWFENSGSSCGGSGVSPC
jgi:hypothetical protein